MTPKFGMKIEGRPTRQDCILFVLGIFVFIVFLAIHLLHQMIYGDMKENNIASLKVHADGDCLTMEHREPNGSQ